MGARFAPSYANLFMGFWDDLAIWAKNPFKAHLALYARYIDDILIIWNGSEAELNSFIEYCNSNPFGISSTHSIDQGSLLFLDLELQVDKE